MGIIKTTFLPTPINSVYIDVHTASDPKKYLPLGRRQIVNLCEQGVFKSAFQPGKGGRGSKWMILRSEILAHKFNQHAHRPESRAARY